MIPDNLLHDRENSEDTQQHLNENADKFESDCVFLLKKMIEGEILTRKSVAKKYDMNERRLGNLFESGKCQRRWVMKLNSKGVEKRSHVEYYVERPKVYPNKSDLQKWFSEYIDGKHETPVIQMHQQKLF